MTDTTVREIPELRLIPVTWSDIVLDEHLEHGYALSSALGSTFTVTEYGARILARIDGRLTLGEILNQIRDEALGSASDRPLLEVASQESGLTVDELLLGEAQAFVTAVRGDSAITFHEASLLP